MIFLQNQTNVYMRNVVQCMWNVDGTCTRVLASCYFKNRHCCRVRRSRSILRYGISLNGYIYILFDFYKFYNKLRCVSMYYREAVLRPAASSIIPELFRPSLRGRANGMFSWGIYWGYGLTFTLGNYLAPLDLFKQVTNLLFIK